MKKLSALVFVVFLMYSCSLDNDISDAYGNFEAREVVVSAETGGKIMQFDPEEGEVLEEGQVIAIIDSTDLVLKKAQLIASRESVLAGLAGVNAQTGVYKQQLANLKKDEQRVSNLLKAEAATEKQMDDITGNIHLVERQMDAVEAQRKSIIEQSEVFDEQIAQVKESISRCRVTSPIKGSLLVRYAEKGELAMPGKPLFKVSNTEQLFLRVYVSGEQLASIHIGQQVKVLVDKDRKDNRELEGTITWISSEAEFTPKIIQTKKERVNMVYAVKVMVNNDGYLKIGMPGEIIFNGQ